MFSKVKVKERFDEKPGARRNAMKSLEVSQYFKKPYAKEAGYKI